MNKKTNVAHLTLQIADKIYDPLPLGLFIFDPLYITKKVSDPPSMYPLPLPRIW